MIKQCDKFILYLKHVTYRMQFSIIFPLLKEFLIPYFVPEKNLYGRTNKLTTQRKKRRGIGEKK